MSWWGLQEQRVTTCLELVEARQAAVRAGRSTRPWQSSCGRYLGLADPADDSSEGGGGTLYVITLSDYMRTRFDERLHGLVRAALSSEEGWIGIFGGDFWWGDHLWTRGSPRGS